MKAYMPLRELQIFPPSCFVGYGMTKLVTRVVVALGGVATAADDAKVCGSAEVCPSVPEVDLRCRTAVHSCPASKVGIGVIVKRKG
jgi:hypothetical protein